MTSQCKAVFLSYASEDLAAAEEIAGALKSAGIEVWFDKSELRGGDAWDASIRQQIRSCALFVPLISASTDARLEGYFRREWKLAANRTHDMAAGRPFLIPVVLDATSEISAEVPEEFRSVHWTRLRSGALPADFVPRISELVNARPASREFRETPDPVIQTSGTRKGGAPLAPRAPGSRSNRGRLLAAALALVLVSILAAVGFVWRHGSRPATPPAAESVAVLPFLDLSERHDQEYFADGLAEEVRDLLAQVTDLHVPARTSSFYFKGRQTTTADIARILGVAHVLEGSVRRAGDRIRVSVELARTDSGHDVWSQNYDREVKDIFAVQEEIATAVVAALKLRLSPAAAPVSARQTKSPQAYEAFLRGRERFYAGTAASHSEAISHLRHAIELDPGYAAAYAWLAQAMGSQTSFLERSATDEEIAERQRLVQRAIEMAPRFADAYAVRTIIDMGTANWAAADADSSKAVELDPRDSRALRYRARYLASQGDLTHAMEFINRALVLDPLDVYAHEFRAEFQESRGARDSARADLERILQIAPARDQASFYLAWLDLREGKIDDALRRMESLPQRSWRASVDAGASCARGDQARGITVLDSWVASVGRDAPMRDIVKAYAFCGAAGKAVALMEAEINRGNERYGDFLVESLLYSPDFAPLKGDSGFESLLGRLHLKPA